MSGSYSVREAGIPTPQTDVEHPPHEHSSADEESLRDPEDAWALVDPPQVGPPWEDQTRCEKFVTVLLNVLKVIALLGLLYLFICSLDFLSSAFRLLGGKAAGEAFTNIEVLKNPIACIGIGVVATVILQSSSTTTSIIVTMVASDFLPVWQAIFMVMGANIGTSVTNTIVSLFQAHNRGEFRRSFAGATVHDMFNWLAVLCFLPVEWISGSIGSWSGCGVLCQMTGIIVNGTFTISPNMSYADKEFLKVITKPFTKLIIQLDKKIITQIATGDESAYNKTLVKHFCGSEEIPLLANNSFGNDTYMTTETVKTRCVFMFEYFAQFNSDTVVGACVLVLAVLTLCTCLFFIVKLLHRLLRGSIAKWVKKFLNSDLPGPVGKHITGYLAILIGAGLTILVQSSSIFTSAMTPLVGAGVLHIERMYPLTLGANIGTTVTAILASLASDAAHLQITLQVALCHLFFNIFGIMIWYPIPYLRKIPIAGAKFLGNTTARYRWFAGAYLVVMFFLFPGAVFGLSVAGWEVLVGVLVPIIVLIIILIIIKVMQSKCPQRLPEKLQNWKFLPKFMRSLEPYDAVFIWIYKVWKRCCPCCTAQFRQQHCPCQRCRAGPEEEEEVAAEMTNVVVEATQVNGHTNGLNGHTNGLNGHTNGLNGHTNGVNGHTNGVNGHTNGHVNGVNGSNGTAMNGTGTGAHIGTNGVVNTAFEDEHTKL